MKGPLRFLPLLDLAPVLEHLLAALLPASRQRFPHTCGNAAIRACLARRGVLVTEVQLARQIRPQSTGFGFLTIGEMTRVMALMGYSSRAAKVDSNCYPNSRAPHAWIVVMNPCCLPWVPTIQRRIQDWLPVKIHHALAAWPLANGKIAVVDPSWLHGGTRQLTGKQWSALLRTPGISILEIVHESRWTRCRRDTVGWREKK